MKHFSRIAIGSVLYLSLGCSSPCPSCRLLATGQTMETVVDRASADYPGQDGFYQKGCPLAGRFVDNGDGTITDSCTGLMWQKETAPGWYMWGFALRYCEGLTLAGHGDWRLPNVRELQSIVDYGRFEPAINPVFGAEPRGVYWSSSTFTLWPIRAWPVEFHVGAICGTADKDNYYHVRAVRGGL